MWYLLWEAETTTILNHWSKHEREKYKFSNSQNDAGLHTGNSLKYDKYWLVW